MTVVVLIRIENYISRALISNRRLERFIETLNVLSFLIEYEVIFANKMNIRVISTLFVRDIHTSYLMIRPVQRVSRMVEIRLP